MNTLHLSVKNASYKFAKHCPCLPDIDIFFEGLLVIKGQIGCGKTLLLKTLGGALEP